MIEAMANLYSRRSVLMLSAATGATVLAACSGDEPGQADPTATAGPDPTKQPPEATTAPVVVADLDAIQAAWERGHLLLSHAESIDDAAEPVARRLDEARAALDGQLLVLTELLETAAVRLPDPPVYQSDEPDDDDSAADDDETDEERAEREAAETAARVADIAQAFAGDATTQALADLAAVSEVNLPMLVALTATRAGIAQTLGRPAPQIDLAGPRGTGAADLVDVLRPAVYAFEVLAAQTSGTDRDVYLTRLTPLRRLTRQLRGLGGDQVAPPPLGYRFEQDVGTVEGRRALAAEVLTAIPPVAIAALSAAASASDTEDDQTADPADTVAGVVRVVAEVIGIGAEFDLAPDPFPGLDSP